MSRTDAEIERLAARLADERSRRVVFVSHCLLNQNVRYLGGAWTAGIASDAVEQFIREGVGLYQMPCPEQAAWGGVMKRFILRFYGARATWAYRFRGLLLPVFRLYTRSVYRRLASRTARHIADYARSGFQVIGIVGVGDSPSCGVLRTLNIKPLSSWTGSIARRSTSALSRLASWKEKGSTSRRYGGSCGGAD